MKGVFVIHFALTQFSLLQLAFLAFVISSSVSFAMLTLFYHHIISFWVIQQHPQNHDANLTEHHHHLHNGLPVHPPNSWTSIFTSACMFLYSSACHAWDQSHLLLLPPSTNVNSKNKEPTKVTQEQTVGNPTKDLVTLLTQEGFAKADGKPSASPPLTSIDEQHHDSDDEDNNDAIQQSCKDVRQFKWMRTPGLPMNPVTRQ